MSFSEEKRKKLIVPAVALMMCAVAMIGIGYAALSSTIENSGNEVSTEKLSATLYKDSNKNGLLANGSIKDNVSVEYYTKQVGNQQNYYISTEETTIGSAYLVIDSTLSGRTSVNLQYIITTSGPDQESFTIKLYEDKETGEDTELPSSINLSNGTAEIPILVKIVGLTTSSAGTSAAPLSFNVEIIVS